MGSSRSLTIDELRSSLRSLEISSRHFDRSQQQTISTGITPLDRMLPHGGLLCGTLNEWTSISSGSGALTLALLTAHQCQQRGAIVVIDPSHNFYPPAAELLGICCTKLVIIRPDSQLDTLWTLEQSLRCRGVSAVLAMTNRLPPQKYRRFQRAAEHGGTLGLFVRTQTSARYSGGVDIQFAVKPLSSIPETHARRLCLNVQHAKGAFYRTSLILEVEHDRAVMCVASELPDSAISHQAS